MSIATSSVGTVFVMMAASMTGLVTWNYNTASGIGREGLAEQSIAEIVLEGDAQEHEALEALESRLVTDVMSNNLLNTDLLADIPLAAWAVIALLPCIEMFAVAWILRVLKRCCCRRRRNGWKVTELEDAAAENVRGNGPLSMLLSPAHEKTPLLVSSQTNALAGETEEDTENVVEDSVATNGSEICPLPVLLSPSRPTADNREKAVPISSPTTDLTGEGRCVPCCAPPCDTLSSDFPCETQMRDAHSDTCAQSDFVKSLTVDLTGEGRCIPLRDIPCDTVDGDFPRDTLMSDFSCDAFTSALGSSCGQYLTKSLDLTGLGRIAVNKLDDQKEQQGPPPTGSVSSESSIEVELFGGSSDATITMDLTSGRSGWGRVDGSRR